MGLFAKVRVLVGALAHKPFMPRPEKVDLDDGAVGAPPAPESHRRPAGILAAGAPDLESHPAQAEPLPDTSRVADLIARRKGDA